MYCATGCRTASRMLIIGTLVTGLLHPCGRHHKLLVSVSDGVSTGDLERASRGGGEIWMLTGANAVADILHVLVERISTTSFLWTCVWTIIKFITGYLSPPCFGLSASFIFIVYTCLPISVVLCLARFPLTQNARFTGWTEGSDLSIRILAVHSTTYAVLPGLIRGELNINTFYLFIYFI